MVEEVEVDTEDRVAVDLAHGPGGDAPAGEVEGHVPPVVAPHAGGQADLADDLAEPMQRLLGVLPGGQGDRWEQLHACTLRSSALLTLPAIDRLALESTRSSSRLSPNQHKSPFMRSYARLEPHWGPKYESTLDISLRSFRCGAAGSSGRSGP